MTNDSDSVPPAQDEIAALVYELLDAHADTVVLADDLVAGQPVGRPCGLSAQPPARRARDVGPVG